MKRRTIIGLGGSALIGLSTVGTGAFASVRAERALTIETTDDAGAYLVLNADDSDLDNSAYATEADGLIEIDITEETETGEAPNGDPVNTDGVNPFATTTIEGVFSVENQGSQDVEVSITSIDNEFDENSRFQMFATGVPGKEDEFRTNLFEGTGDLPVLSPGDSFATGLEIDATDDLSELEDLLADLQVTVQAFAVSEGDQI